MTDPNFTLEELGSRFGILLAQAMAQITVFEKRLTMAQETEMALVQTIDELRAEIVRLKGRKDTGLSPELETIAAAGKAVIDRNG